MYMNEPEPATAKEAQKKIKITDSEVVCGYQIIQTRDVNWLCLDEIYEKFHRPNFYDIGGTYTQDVSDYWLTFKTEQVGSIFLLHLFICNHGVDPFRVALSCSNQLKIDKKKNIVYIQQPLKEFQFKKVKHLAQNYLTSYSFSDLDVECFKDRKLYIAASFAFGNTGGIGLDIINNIKLNHDCGALLTDPIGSDFTIESSDGAKFQVHKVILTAHSEVFKAMLKEETAESQNNYVKLIDVGEDDLRYMLEYIYTGTIKYVETINFASLLMLADRYNLQGLWKLSQYVLSEQINCDNALDILVIADMYDSDFLKIEAMKFIKRNVEVLESGTFKEINNASLIRELCTYLAS